MPNWFRKGLPPHHTALAMIGAKAGDLVTIIGADDPDLAAEVARVTGLTGQTVVCDAGPTAEVDTAGAAARAGVLVEFSPAPPTALPFDSGSRDVSVVMLALSPLDEASRSAVLVEAVRVLRPGGRVVIVDGKRTTGLLSRLKPARPRVTATAALDVLERAGTRARRQLADVDGVAFYEGRRAGDEPR